ncbi:hypothetical protein RJ639_024052 [Escallonia herrerae]|uniref:Initiator tRNA phosphoribosyl transferase family protein n=1 Tax=Escallonia herrerae TaxID=1293975 RepID=A0AA89ACU3_9ASTE|nr:hypothetical protein RJ639_024052 [Escallonia herrerae]
MEDDRMSIYRASRAIKRRDSSHYNALRSIHEDSIFAAPQPPLRLLVLAEVPLHLLLQVHRRPHEQPVLQYLSPQPPRGQRGGCMIVDSTRKGKRFPDSMSKTIPIWTCVVNRAIMNYRNELRKATMERESSMSDQNGDRTLPVSPGWDCSLHLPIWVPDTERAAIEDLLDEWTKQLEASGADVASLASSLRRPLRPLWISQKTVIWLNEVPEITSWDFTPIMLVSASSSSGIVQRKTTSEFSWNYILGAGDDEESWARGLSPNVFWNHIYDLINSGPDFCNQKVADIVEKDSTPCTKGQNAPQLSATSLRSSRHCSSFEEMPLRLDLENLESSEKVFGDDCAISWLGSTNMAVGANMLGTVSACTEDAEAYVHLPIVDSKFDRLSLLRNLPSALNFAKLNLQKGKRLLVCCNNGEDISVCVCLAILTSLFNDAGLFDNGKSFCETRITKLEMRQKLVFICKYAVNARPSRGNLKQVYKFLNGGSFG